MVKVKHPALLLSLILMATATLAATGRTAESPRRPNVLFISFDDLGDWMKLLDPASPIAMPNLDRLARDPQYPGGIATHRAWFPAREASLARDFIPPAATR